MFSAELMRNATELLQALRASNRTLATAESCTGGLISGLLTEIAGSSDVVDRGFVTYSNAAKTEMLGVEPEIILTHGAVSQAVARAMAVGALNRSNADLAVAVTGVAGPGGGMPEKPVGLVHLAAVNRAGFVIHRAQQFGAIGRTNIRLETIAQALDLLRVAANA
jgi:nicotinamide-nucleotide amidase